MFMVNEVNLSAEERAFVKEQYPDFTGNTAADVYRHTKSEKVVDDMYSNNQQQALKEQAEERSTLNTTMIYQLMKLVLMMIYLFIKVVE
jgi:hypothetical protein